MKQKQLFKASILLSLATLSSNAYASDMQSTVAHLALCARHIIDVNTSPQAV